MRRLLTKAEAAEHCGMSVKEYRMTEVVELTEAERDLGPCMCCGNPKLGRWQVVWCYEDVVGALCFECYAIHEADNIRLLKMIEFHAACPEISFSPREEPEE